MKIDSNILWGVTRREFIQRTGVTVLSALAASPAFYSAPAGGKKMNSKIAFNTANLVARVSQYRYNLGNWMIQHQKTVEATDVNAWRAICHEIAAAGFKAVEIWEAHASPERLDESRAREWKQIMDQSGLKPVAYAGQLSRETLQICRWLEIPHIDGGLGNLTPAQATELCREFKIGFNLENHPEKSAEEILKKIGGGNEWLGVCIDTGWLGTQGVSAPLVIKACGALVRHTHIKDVQAVGSHLTCLLGEGIVNIAACLKTYHDLKYSGWYSWEDEPEDRNPFDSAPRNRQWLEAQLKL
jgi:L-ribulose-5-phosphate 3-epimerase